MKAAAKLSAGRRRASPPCTLREQPARGRVSGDHLCRRTGVVERLIPIGRVQVRIDDHGAVAVPRVCRRGRASRRRGAAPGAPLCFHTCRYERGVVCSVHCRFRAHTLRLAPNESGSLQRRLWPAWCRSACTLTSSRRRCRTGTAPTQARTPSSRASSTCLASSTRGGPPTAGPASSCGTCPTGMTATRSPKTA